VQPCRIALALSGDSAAQSACLTAQTWAGVTAIMLAMLSALANFFFIPYYPIWSLLVIGLDIWVIWALTRPGAIKT
jgi:hypothetical protein